MCRDQSQFDADADTNSTGSTTSYLIPTQLPFRNGHMLDPLPPSKWQTVCSQFHPLNLLSIHIKIRSSTHRATWIAKSPCRIWALHLYLHTPFSYTLHFLPRSVLGIRGLTQATTSGLSFPCRRPMTTKRMGHSKTHQVPLIDVVLSPHQNHSNNRAKQPKVMWRERERSSIHPQINLVRSLLSILSSVWWKEFTTMTASIFQMPGYQIVILYVFFEEDFICVWSNARASEFILLMTFSESTSFGVYIYT